MYAISYAICLRQLVWCANDTIAIEQPEIVLDRLEIRDVQFAAAVICAV